MAARGKRERRDQPADRIQPGSPFRKVEDIPLEEFKVPGVAKLMLGLSVVVALLSIGLGYLSTLPPAPPRAERPARRAARGEGWVMERVSRNLYHLAPVAPPVEAKPAAEGLAEVSLSRMDPRRAAQLLELLEPETAAAFLALTPGWRVGRIVEEMSDPKASQVLLLLRSMDGLPVDEVRLIGEVAIPVASQPNPAPQGAGRGPSSAGQATSQPAASGGEGAQSAPASQGAQSGP